MNKQHQNVPILEAKGVRKRFPSPDSDINVLRDIDLTVKAGESWSIRGESGAGKSTLLNILTLLERPDKGEIYWRGDPVTCRSNSFLAEQRGRLFGLVFQSYYMIPELDALENVLIARRLLGRIKPTHRERAKALMERVGLKDRMKHKTTQLSGGEVQRVALTRALMNQPSIIIADEPTGNLDEKTGLGVMDMLLELTSEENTALILVTHNPYFTKRTEHHCFLTQGTLQSI